MKKSIWFFSILVHTARAQMSGIFSVAFCKWHHIARGCSAKLCSPSSGLQQQMKSSLTAPLACQHGLAVGKHGTELFINRTLLISCLLWSNLQCVMGLICLNTAGSCSELCPREPQSFRRLPGCEGMCSVPWAGCLTPLPQPP